MLYFAGKVERIGEHVFLKLQKTEMHRLLYCDFAFFVLIFLFVWHTEENFIRDRILPAYGNTHTLSTATARQSTFFRFWAAKG